MSDIQLIYASQPFGYDDLSLIGILEQARRNNAEAGITGCLVCREDIFIQLLEGPASAVEATFARIRGDERHANVALLWSGAIDNRLFPDWTMRHDPARSWMWSTEDVASGAVEKASSDEIRSIFARLATEPTDAISTKASGCPVHHKP